MKDSVISLKNISKHYAFGQQRTLKEVISTLLSTKNREKGFWALRDINLEIKKGETIGIIGKNGSGKSTLLKMLAGVSYPTSGDVTVNGKIAPLIELGAGFHPELNGRENIYLNATILGMTRTEIDAAYNDIVAFSELGEFIYSPIKHYSSGMYLRLAFSVAIHTNPDILLIDEILAVGDTNFQVKCLDRVQYMLAEKQVTLLLVSHSPQTILQMCKRAVWLQDGEIHKVGTAMEVSTAYSRLELAEDSTSAFQSDGESGTEEKDDHSDQWGDMKAQISNINIDVVSGKIISGMPLNITMTINNPEKIPNLKVALGLYSLTDNTYMTGVSTQFDEFKLPDDLTFHLTLTVPRLNFNRGNYYVRAVVFSTNEVRPHHFLHKPLTFTVHPDGLTRGVMTPEHSWLLQ